MITCQKRGGTSVWSDHRRSAWILETAELGPYAGGGVEAELDRFAAAVTTKGKIDASKMAEPIPSLAYTTVGGHRIEIVFRPFGKPYTDQHRIDGTVVDYRAYPLMHNPWVHQDVDGNTLTLTHGRTTRTHDFTAWAVAEAERDDGAPAPPPGAGRTRASAPLVRELQPLSVRGVNYYPHATPWSGMWTKTSPEVWETDTSRFFGNWQAIIAEAGERYGTRLAGWWFDDGAVNYYYRSAPWQDLARAAKAGNPQRLVAFNPWELNSPTEFQDFFTGEGFEAPGGYNQLLAPGGNGRYPSGTHEGLQGSACLIAERDWVHTRRDTPPAPPKWDVARLHALIKGFMACRSVPIFNLEITQDGRLCPESIALFAQVSAQLPSAAPPAGRVADLSGLHNPVWTSADNLRDPSVLKIDGGYRIYYSRLAGRDWSSPRSWHIAEVSTRDFVTYENGRDVSPESHASPGDVVKWHGRWLLPYQSYPAQPTRLVYSESEDLQAWSPPKVFLDEAAHLPWNDARRVIDPTLVVDGDTLHCWFVGTTMKPSKANLLGHAITRDPKLEKWEILTPAAPLLGRSERAPDGVENVMVYRTGDHWTMLFSEGLETQHLAWAVSTDLRQWDVKGQISVPRQNWMARKYGAPFVWRETDEWRMILMGENAKGRTTFGMLTSADGTHWALLPEVSMDH